MICKHILLIPFLDESELFLNTVKWFHVMLYKSHHLISVICLYTQFVLFDLLTGPNQVLPLRTRVDLGAMAMKGYSTFWKTPRLEPHQNMV